MPGTPLLRDIIAYRLSKLPHYDSMEIWLVTALVLTLIANASAFIAIVTGAL
jgi:hypothetical protein